LKAFALKPIFKPPFGTYSSPVLLGTHRIGLSFFPFSFKKAFDGKGQKEAINKFFNLLNPLRKMELQQSNGGHIQNGAAKEVTSAQQNGEVKSPATNGKVEAVKKKPAPVKEPKPEVHQNGQSKPEEPKPEAVQVKEEGLPAKPTLNLEGKLKVVDDLHRKSIYRLNLKSRISQLEAFEVALAQEHDELEDNPYQGCRLIIEDDKKQQFVTTTPGLIRLVSQFIFNACHEKLVEIEASIVFPNA